MVKDLFRSSPEDANAQPIRTALSPMSGYESASCHRDLYSPPPVFSLRQGEKGSRNNGGPGHPPSRVCYSSPTRADQRSVPGQTGDLSGAHRTTHRADRQREAESKLHPRPPVADRCSKTQVKELGGLNGI